MNNLTNNIPTIFKRGSNYQKVFELLYVNREKGITRERLVKALMAKTKRSEQLCRFDVGVVSSPAESGEAHKSANGAANYFWVRKYDGGCLQLFMRQ